MPEPGEERVSARPFWTGTISFGLVSIPVELYPAQRRERLALRLLSPQGVPLRRRFAAPAGREVERDRIVRGYETAKGRYVVVTDEELRKLAPRASRDIDLRRFVPRAELDPAYFERAYFLAPGKDSSKAYRLLADAMQRTRRAGIASFVMRGTEYSLAIFAENGILRAETLRSAEELRSPRAVGLPARARTRAKEVSAFSKEITRLTKPGLAEKELEDPAAHALRELVERKRRKGQDVVESVDEKPGGEVIDLVEILRKSMRGSRKARRA